MSRQAQKSDAERAFEAEPAGQQSVLLQRFRTKFARAVSVVHELL